MKATLKRTFHLVIFLTIVGSLFYCATKNNPDASLADISRDKHRPYYHFTPDSMWMNDPNGLVFNNDTYHLFYQYYPDSTVWGPMHWGHATSRDMVSWEHKAIALYPDENGYIFSGSAVVDHQNTAGFGTVDNPSLVAIFTYHDPVGALEGKIDFETQGIAYSLDNGESWTKYENNPVLLNPSIEDFRDPKVRWFEKENKWIMTLAVKDHIRFYSSPNLKDWKMESEFGKAIGAHGGVWECPDLFPLKSDAEDEEFWILIVSLNPGGPNGGSGTQYFIGNFNGSEFTPIDTEIRWLNYGPDDYAGVTWSNTGDRTLFMGWMSNWKYATVVPTEKWRSAMTVARELKLVKTDYEMAVSSLPVLELNQYFSSVYESNNLEAHDKIILSDLAQAPLTAFSLEMKIDKLSDFGITLSNDSGEDIILNFDKDENKFLMDRSRSGKTDFHPEFSQTITASRHSMQDNMDLRLVVDAASMEVFADHGTTVLTAIYFPEKEFSNLALYSPSGINLSTLKISRLK